MQEASPNGLPTVSVARPGHWGNPFDMLTFGRERAVKLFENTVQGAWSPGLFDGDPDALIDEAYRLHCAFLVRHSLDDYHMLRGKNLACWCALPKPGEPDRCHAAVLLRLANTA